MNHFPPASKRSQLAKRQTNLTRELKSVFSDILEHVLHFTHPNTPANSINLGVVEEVLLIQNIIGSY
jgi:hypothetical protein